MAVYDVTTTEKKASPSLVAGGTLYADNPLGTILPFGGSDIPSGWLLCDGAAVSRTTYSELFAVIGTAFGSGDGSTTFNLPDMRESVPKGAGLTGKTVGAHLDADGLTVGEFLDDRVQVHEHYIGDTATPQHLGYSDREGQNAGIGNRTVDATIESDRKWIALQQSNVGIAKSGRYGATTEVKSVGVNYIIKAKMASVPADFLAKVDDVLTPTVQDVSVSGKYNCTYVKSGKVVTVNLEILDTSYAANATIISAGVLPKSAIIQIVELGGNDPTETTPFTNAIVLKTDGSISQIGHYPMNSNMEFFFGSFTYTTSD